MRTNGILYYPTSSATAPQFDEDGVPVVSTPSSLWSDPVPCHIKMLSSSSKGTNEDGTFHQASYQVLVERNAIPEDTKKVKLERNGVTIGEFQVQGYPEVINLDRIQIIL